MALDLRISKQEKSVEHLQIYKFNMLDQCSTNPFRAPIEPTKPTFYHPLHYDPLQMIPPEPPSFPGIPMSSHLAKTSNPFHSEPSFLKRHLLESPSSYLKRLGQANIQPQEHQTVKEERDLLDYRLRCIDFYNPVSIPILGDSLLPRELPGYSPSPPPSPTSYNRQDSVIESKETEPTTTRCKRGRPRKHSPKILLPPLYVFLRNLLWSKAYNSKVIAWVNKSKGTFKINRTAELAKTWGRMKSNRGETMNYEKMSRAMRYHYGSKKSGRKGHLAMVKEKRLVYKFGELAGPWSTAEVPDTKCEIHELCKGQLCLWTKE